jgi:nucleoid-associated protein YgaU
MKIRTEIKAGYACYTVKSGDTLASIAGNFYGKSTTAGVNKIYFSNMAAIGPNPNKIYPGQKLYIPT